MKYSLLFLSLAVSFSTFAGSLEFRRHNNYRDQRSQARVLDTAEINQAPSDDQKLVQAIQSRRNVFYVQASNLTVTKLLPDDRKGLPHQKFVVSTSSGVTVLCVYNLDQGQKIPLKVGDEVSIGGEFKWTDQGPLMHWLHEDSRNQRPDGYVELAGRRYGLN